MRNFTHRFKTTAAEIGRRRAASNAGADVAEPAGQFRDCGSWGMNHAESFFGAAAQICRDISFAKVEALAAELKALRERKGRLFLIGVGGSAGNCSHAVN